MSIQWLEMQRVLQSEGVLICFAGRFTQALIVEYSEAVKKYLELEDRPKNEIYNIFSIFIEQTQNINRYCAALLETEHYDPISQSSIVTIGKKDDYSFVCSGNMILNENIDALISKLDVLALQDAQGLKQMYKMKLKETPASDQLSAGMGLIDMARKASRPLDYSIVHMDEMYSFFTLKAII